MSQVIELVLQSSAHFHDTNTAFTNEHNQSINKSQHLWIVQNLSLLLINAKADIFQFNPDSLISFKMQKALACDST